MIRIRSPRAWRLGFGPDFGRWRQPIQFGSLAIVIGLVALAGLGHAQQVPPDDAKFFTDAVEPLLKQRCYGCHSHAAKKLEGNLALDVRSGWVRGGDSGPAVVPGKPDESLLIKAVRRSSPDLAMPPEMKLPAAEIETLVAWVKRGAPDPRQPNAAEATGGWAERFAERRRLWCWQPMQHPPVPAVRDATWALETFDRFIAAARDVQQLEPAVDADRATLARRLSFVLTGLPPAADEVDEFASDPAPDAYERLVDRWLASPRLGEHWARHWLDLFRYSDTHGSEHDPLIPHAWKYRDYLIRALNVDVPFDRFVREHLAGDLLPPRRNPRDGFNESPIGTGVQRFVEFYPTPLDVKNEEILVLDSQIDLFSKSFLGLTLSCARCHDHKFDAISARDYQAIYGVFASTRTTMRRVEDPAPRQAVAADLAARVPALRDALAARWREQITFWPDAVVAAQKQLAANTPAAKPEETRGPNLGLALETQRWGRALAEAKDRPLDVLHPLARVATLGAPTEDAVPPESWSGLAQQLHAATQQRTKDSATRFRHWADFTSPTSESHGRWFASADFPDIASAGAMAIAPAGPALLTAIYPAGRYTHLLSNKQGGTFRSPNFTLDMKFVSVLASGTNAGRVRLVIENFPSDTLLFAQAMPSVNEPRLHWVTMPVREAWAGRRAYLEICPRDEMPYPGKIPDASKLLTDGRSGVGIGAVVFHDQPGTPPIEPALPSELWQAEPQRSAIAHRFTQLVLAALERWTTNRATNDDARLLDSLLRAGLLVNEAPADHPLERLVREYRQREAEFPVPMRVAGVADDVGFDEAFFPRGNYRRAEGVVPRRFLEALGGEPLVVAAPANGSPGAPTEGAASPADDGVATNSASGSDRWNQTRDSGRLTLAEAIVRPNNPLTWRVIVNRLWLHVHDAPLVGSVDNFGTLGEQPSHPELLDHLAGEFLASDASMKEIIRRMVTTRTFRQSTTASAAARERDPANRWWSHANLRRLSAESLRDAMLAASDRLDRRMGGLGVPLPLRAAYKDFENPISGPLDGDGRRSIYLEARRNYPQPLLIAFDQPKPVLSVGWRRPTNVPAQSLMLLNDAFVHQQAEVVARQLPKELSTDDRIGALYRRTLGRSPTSAEQQRATALLRDQAAVLGVAPEAIGSDERVWVDLAHALFNVKEFLYVR